MTEYRIKNYNGQKTEHQDSTCGQNFEVFGTENLSSCCQAGGKPEDSCSGRCNVSREAQCKCQCLYGHYITTELKETEEELQLICRALHAPQPSKARDVNPPMEATNASVPKNL